MTINLQVITVLIVKIRAIRKISGQKTFLNRTNKFFSEETNYLTINRYEKFFLTYFFLNFFKYEKNKICLLVCWLFSNNIIFL